MIPDDEHTRQIMIDLCEAIYTDVDASYYLKQIARIARAELVKDRDEAYIRSHDPAINGDDA